MGDALMGWVVDPLGRPRVGRGAVASTTRLPIERAARGITDSAPVIVPLQTGINVIDLRIPINRDQRELILEDRLDNIPPGSLADAERSLREALLDMSARLRKHIGSRENFGHEDRESRLRLCRAALAGFRPATLLKSENSDRKQDVPNPVDIGRD